MVQSGTACSPLRSSLNSSKLCRFYILTRLDRRDDYPLHISLRFQTFCIPRRIGLHVTVEWRFWRVLVPWELHCANYCCFHLYPVGVDSYTWHYHLFIKLKSQKITCEQSANTTSIVLGFAAYGLPLAITIFLFFFVNNNTWSCGFLFLYSSVYDNCAICKGKACIRA